MPRAGGDDVSALTADQRAELRIVAEAAAADPDFDGDTVDSMAGLTPSYDDVFLPPTAIALLDALDAAEATLALAAIEAAEKLEALAETWDAEDGDHLGFIPDPDYFVGLGRCATELRNIIGLAD